MSVPTELRGGRHFGQYTRPDETRRESVMHTEAQRIFGERFPNPNLLTRKDIADIAAERRERSTLISEILGGVQPGTTLSDQTREQLHILQAEQYAGRLAIAAFRGKH